MTLQIAKYSNFFETTLDGAVGASDTQLDLSAAPTDGASAIAAPFYLVVNPDSTSKREVILVTALSGTNMQTVTRDVEGRHSPNPTHDDGATVRMAVVGEMFEDLHDRINDVALTGDVTGTLASATQDVATTIAAGAVDFAMINQGDLITQSETITSNDSDTKIPTTAAVKNYADAETATLTNKTLGAVTLSGAVTGGDQTIAAVALKDYAETDQDVTSQAELAINLANGNTGSVTLAHSVTDIDFTNVPAAGISTFTLIVTQDGTGSRTMAINKTTVNGQAETAGKTPNAGGLTLSTAAGSIDVVTFIFQDAGTRVLIIPQLAFG
tara:strand:+ start:2016 stop:2993 length:978 start_codon:yes stop_codon:yes gene_type:complete